MFSRERYPQKSFELGVLETGSLTNLSSSRTTPPWKKLYREKGVRGAEGAVKGTRTGG